MSRQAVESAIDMTKQFRNKTWEQIAAMMQRAGVKTWEMLLKSNGSVPEGEKNGKD